MTDLLAVRAALTPRTRMIYSETIANPTLSVPDLTALAGIAHDGEAVLVVDSTFATPVICRPLEHGADLVVHSATKFLAGQRALQDQPRGLDHAPPARRHRSRCCQDRAGPGPAVRRRGRSRGAAPRPAPGAGGMLAVVTRNP